jgi:Double zinc ribbon
MLSTGSLPPCFPDLVIQRMLRSTQSTDWDSAMPAQESETRQCPFCKEEVRADAVRCKHCQAAIPLLKPDHQGVCPFCKESINTEAIRCKHCGANLAPPEQYFDYPERPPTRRVQRRQATTPVAYVPRPRERRVPRRLLAQSAPEGCNDYEIDGAGIWTFKKVDEDGNCVYELTDPAIEPGF